MRYNKMKLTKERAIAEHRKMWLWISRQIMKDYLANRTVREIYSYKCDYLNKVYPNEIISYKCFCCEYVRQTSENRYSYKDCALYWNCYKDCPLYWNDDRTKYTCDEHLSYYEIIAITTSTYRTCCGFKEAKKMARMAYKIAMLEEKEQ